MTIAPGGSARGKGRGDEVAAGAAEKEGGESLRWPVEFDAAVRRVARQLQQAVDDEVSVSLSVVRDDHLYDRVKGVSYTVQPDQRLGQWTLEYDTDEVESYLLVQRASDDRSVRVDFKGDESYRYEADPAARRLLFQEWLDHKYRDLLIEYAPNALSAYPLRQGDVDRFMAEFEAEKRARIEGRAGETRDQRKERLLRGLLSYGNHALLYRHGNKILRADEMNDDHMQQHMAVGGRADKTHFHPLVALRSVYLAGFHIIIDNSMRQFLHWAHDHNVVLHGKPTFIVNFDMSIDKHNTDGWQYAHVESEGGAAGHFYPVDENDFSISAKKATTFIVLDRYGQLDREFYHLSFGQDPITLLVDPHTRDISERFNRILQLRIPSPSTPEEQRPSPHHDRTADGRGGGGPAARSGGRR
ncbi:MAG: hypothetical protein AABY34_03450 [Pseudomonadota bacterium]